MIDIVVQKLNDTDYIVFNTTDPKKDNIIKILTEDEKKNAGIIGYECYIAPVNTTYDVTNNSVKFNKDLIIQQLSDSVRYERDQLLIESDKFMSEDYPIDVETKQKIKQYRQELRDITKHEEFPMFPSTNGKIPFSTKPYNN